MVLLRRKPDYKIRLEEGAYATRRERLGLGLEKAAVGIDLTRRTGSKAVVRAKKYVLGLEKKGDRGLQNAKAGVDRAFTAFRGEVRKYEGGIIPRSIKKP